jgi:putative thioredoxin
MTTEHIINASEADFENEVLAYSQVKPVVVDFWAAWCRPCKTLSPMLDRLAMEGQGSFRLARVDVDQNPNLAIRYGVRTLPTVKVFTDGQVTSEFVGIQPETRLREILSNLAQPSPANLAVEKADSLLAAHQWVEAEMMYRRILQQHHELPAAVLGLSKSLIGMNRGAEALDLLRHFPPSRQYPQAQTILPLAEAQAASQRHALPQESDLDAAFENSIRLAGRNNLPAAIDGMLEILRQNRQYRNGLARQVVLGLLEILGEEDPLTRQYRSELASILF